MVAKKATKGLVPLCGSQPKTLKSLDHHQANAELSLKERDRESIIEMKVGYFSQVVECDWRQ